MSDTDLDLDAARAATAALPHNGDQIAVALDNLFRLDAKLVEAVDPAPEESLEAVPSSVRPGFRAIAWLVPLEVRVEQLKNET
jgi:hypothetical protein